MGDGADVCDHDLPIPAKLETQAELCAAENTGTTTSANLRDFSHQLLIMNSTFTAIALRVVGH
jgi:hypothetical protein